LATIVVGSEVGLAGAFFCHFGLWLFFFLLRQVSSASPKFRSMGFGAIIIREQENESLAIE